MPQKRKMGTDCYKLVFLPFEFSQALVNNKFFGADTNYLGLGRTSGDNYSLKKDFYGSSNDLIFVKETKLASGCMVKGRIFCLNHLQFSALHTIYGKYLGINPSELYVVLEDQKRKGEKGDNISPLRSCFSWVCNPSDIPNLNGLPTIISVISANREYKMAESVYRELFGS